MKLVLLAVAIAVTASATTPTNGLQPQPAATAQFGGRQVGIPFESTGLIVVAAESEDSLAAWSHYTGLWTRIPIRAKEQDAIVPILGTNVAAVRIGKMVYGYGAEAGKWHWVETESNNPPSIGTGQVTLRDGDWYYALSSKTGKWSGLNLKTGEIR